MRQADSDFNMFYESNRFQKSFGEDVFIIIIFIWEKLFVILYI